MKATAPELPAPPAKYRFEATKPGEKPLSILVQPQPHETPLQAANRVLRDIRTEGWRLDPLEIAEPDRRRPGFRIRPERKGRAAA